MSKLVTTPVSRSSALRKSVLGMAVAAALAMPQLAAAFEFDTGSDAWSFRWDNTLRVNISDRVSGINHDMTANPNFDDGDNNFEPGSLFTRFDVLSEADLVWKPSWGMLGARVSAAGWWNPAYDSLDGTSIQTANNLTSSGFPTLKLPNYTNRYAKGPSGEFLDWFVFTKFNVGDAPVNIKVGQTTVYWGESLGINAATLGINYGQNPIDVWKGLENPGVDAKEVFRPRVGVNINSQLTDTLYVAAQYFFNWQNFSNQAWRYPEAGSFLSLGDYILWGGKSIVYSQNPLLAAPPLTQGTLCALVGATLPGGPFNGVSGTSGDPADCLSQQYLRLWRGKDITPDENSGNYGIAFRWAPEWVGGTLGFYYRRSYDMQPQGMATPDLLTGLPGAFQAACMGPTAPLQGFWLPNPNGTGNCLQNSIAGYGPGPTPIFNQTGVDFINAGRIGTYNFAYGKDIDMFGVSLSKNVGSLSLGAELVYRHDMPLLSDLVTVMPATLRGLGVPLTAGRIWSDQIPKDDTPGAKGNTLSGLVNLLGVLGSSVWDTASWSAELTWMQWLDVTQNEAVFKGRSNHIVYVPNTTIVDPTKSWSAYKLVDAVDKNYFGLAINFTPTWFQVKPGVDLLTPVSWSQGISGNSPVTGGGQDGAGTFGLGVALDFYQRYRFDLKYVGFYGDYARCKASDGGGTFCTPATGNAVSVFNGTNAVLSDRDFIALTFKTTF